MASDNDLFSVSCLQRAAKYVVDSIHGSGESLLLSERALGKVKRPMHSAAKGFRSRSSRRRSGARQGEMRWKSVSSEAIYLIWKGPNVLNEYHKKHKKQLAVFPNRRSEESWARSWSVLI